MKIEELGQVKSLSAEEVRFWLEWAGQMLLATPVHGVRPSSFRAYWPDYANDSRVAYGYTGERLRAPRPDAKQIELMDEILALPSLIEDVTTRRIVHCRCLVTPLGNRYLYSWSKLAYMLHRDRRWVVRIHLQGLIEISTALEARKIYSVRQSFNNVTK